MALLSRTFQPTQRRTFFAIYSAGRWTLQDAIDLGPDSRLVPFSPNNNLIEVVLLPSEPTIYGSEEKLVADTQQFIHHHVDLDTVFEKVATYYVTLTWLYDAFNELRICACGVITEAANPRPPHHRIALLQVFFCERRFHSLADLPHPRRVPRYPHFR
jgi:hypothetical protein